MSESYLANGEHFQLFRGIDTNEMSPFMRRVGKSIGETVFELGIMGYEEPAPIRIHSESIYHDRMCPYFMLGCVKPAEVGGDTIIYDGVKAARLIEEEAPELESVRMVYHAEHYDDTVAVMPLVRDMKDDGESSLVFRQKFPLNEVTGLPTGWDEDDLYEYIDNVLDRSVEFDQKLTTGDVILIDNYKTLHLRRAFSGLRKIVRVRVDDPAYFDPNDYS